MKKLKSEGWGPWHELGHQYQLSSLTWDQTIEVTTNIYAMAVARMFGMPSRLKQDNIWANIDTYFNIPIENRNFNDNSQLGAFERLALYQQLWLKYGDEFFIKLHKKAREEAMHFLSDEEKMSYFILKASEVTQNNLNGFFKSWGSFFLSKVLVP